MSCADVRVELPTLISRELPPDGYGAVSRHLETCADCQRELITLRAAVALASVAALERSPRTELESEVFSFLDLEPIAQLVSEAPLRHEPPLPLEKRALAHAGVASPKRNRWQRVSRWALPALAASVALLAFLSAQWHSDALDAETQADLAQARMGPWGEEMQVFELAVHGGSATPAPEVTADLRKIEPDSYNLHMRIANYWPTDPGHVCQVWLVGTQDPAPVGSFVVNHPGEVKVANWTMAVDPEDYSYLRITLEDDNDGAMEGPTLMEAPLDL